MEVRINADVVKAEREKRAWSQEELAIAAGVSLRTIQRVEASGAASVDTARALAAVFGRTVHDLKVHIENGRPLVPWLKRYAIASACSVVVACVLFLATRAHAGEIVLDVVLASSSRDIKAFKLLTQEGQQAEARVEGELRILLVPTLKQHDLILLSAEIYTFDGAAFSLLSKPVVLTRNGVDAKIQVAMANGRTIDINVKPEKR